jgi:hypothetical protein
MYLYHVLYAMINIYGIDGKKNNTLIKPIQENIYKPIYIYLSLNMINIPPPTNIKNLFGRWLNGIEKKIKKWIRVGVYALIWAIWNCRNDVSFDNTGHDQFLQVIHKTTHWIHMWSYLLPEDQRVHMDTRCTRLMEVVRTIFNQGGWRRTNRIQDA